MRFRWSTPAAIGLAALLLASGAQARKPATIEERLDGRALMAGTIGPLGTLLPHLNSWLERISELSPDLDIKELAAATKAQTGIDVLSPEAPAALGLRTDAPLGYHSRDPDHESTILVPVLDEAKAVAFAEGVLSQGDPGLKKVRKGKYRGAQLHALVAEQPVGKAKRTKKVPVAAWAVRDGYLYLVTAQGGKNDALVVLKTALAVKPAKSLAKKTRFTQARQAVTGNAGFLYLDLNALLAASIKDSRAEIRKMKKAKSPEAEFLVPMLEEQLKVVEGLKFMQSMAIALEIEAKLLVARSAFIGTAKGLSPWTGKLKATASHPFQTEILAHSAVWATAAIDLPGLLTQIQSSFPLGAAMVQGMLTEFGQLLGVDLQRELLPALSGDVAYVMPGVTPFPSADFPEELLPMQFRHALIVRLTDPQPVLRVLQNIPALASQQGVQVAQRQESGTTVSSIAESGVSLEWGVSGKNLAVTMGPGKGFVEAVTLGRGRGPATGDVFRFAINGPLLSDWLGKAKLPAIPDYAPGGEGAKQWVETRRTLENLREISGRISAGLDRLTGEFRLELK